MRTTDHIQIVPYKGLAYSWFGTRLPKVAPGSTTFSGYLNGPANQQYLALEQFLGNVGLHVVKPGLGKVRWRGNSSLACGVATISRSILPPGKP